MSIGVTTKDLRKIYTTPPPLAAGTGFAFGGIRGPGGKKGPKKEFSLLVLDGVTLEIRPGEIFGLLGPNGAGKTTTIGILTTRVRPTSGQAWIGEFDVWKQQVEAKRLIGVVQQRPNLDFALTAREILMFHAAYYGVGPAERTQRTAAILERFQLSARANELVRGYSGGMMQRLSLARAMMHDPQVLFLDEPSTGLDPQTRLMLWEIIGEYNQNGKTILLTTHNMEEADRLCHRIAIIDHGRLIAQGTPAELKASLPGGYLVRLQLSDAPSEFVERLKQLRAVTEVRTNGNHIDIYAGRGGSMIGEIASEAAAAGVDLHDVHISEPSLENLFVHHTGRSLRQ